jgi:hypothetical protein
MKKLIITLISVWMAVIAMQPAFAEEVGVAKLKMKITSRINEKSYALCLSEMCYPLIQKNKVIPIETGKLTSVIMTDIANMQMHFQKMPASCQVSLKSNQTLVVSGQLVQKGNKAVVVNNLRCVVS